MSVVSVAERMTAEQYLALAEPPEGRPRTELIGGEVVVSDPLPLHSYVAGDLHFALAAWARASSGRGRVINRLDIQLDDRNVVFRRSSPGATAFDVALELDRSQRLESPPLPGFGLDLAELFPRG